MIKRLRTPLPGGTERSTLLWAVSASVLMILLGALDLLHANRPNDRALKTSLVAELLLIGEVRFTAPASTSRRGKRLRLLDLRRGHFQGDDVAITEGFVTICGVVCGLTGGG